MPRFKGVGGGAADKESIMVRKRTRKKEAESVCLPSQVRKESPPPAGDDAESSATLFFFSFFFPSETVALCMSETLMENRGNSNNKLNGVISMGAQSCFQHNVLHAGRKALKEPIGATRARKAAAALDRVRCCA